MGWRSPRIPRIFKLVYDPTHPDANAEGYVEMPNVDLIKEMSGRYGGQSGAVGQHYCV